MPLSDFTTCQSLYLACNLILRPDLVVFMGLERTDGLAPGPEALPTGESLSGDFNAGLWRGVGGDFRGVIGGGGLGITA